MPDVRLESHLTNAMASDQVDDEQGLTKFYKGYRLPGYKYFKPECIEAAIAYKPLDGDVILCGFPRTGNSWMSNIVWLILHKGKPSTDPNVTPVTVVPFMEALGVEHVKAMKPPRFYKNHFPFGLVQINEKAKYIYTYRRPEDTIVSLYHFINSSGIIEYDLETFFSRFLNGLSLYGDYFDHVLEAYSHKADVNVLMVSYENLKANPEKEILHVAKFLGDDYYQSLKTDENLLNKVLKCTSFESMKKNLKPSLRFECQEGRGDPLKIFRQGAVGDGKKTLSEEQLKRLRDVTVTKMSGTELLEEWLK